MPQVSDNFNILLNSLFRWQVMLRRLKRVGYLPRITSMFLEAGHVVAALDDVQLAGEDDIVIVLHVVQGGF